METISNYEFKFDNSPESKISGELCAGNTESLTKCLTPAKSGCIELTMPNLMVFSLSFGKATFQQICAKKNGMASLTHCMATTLAGQVQYLQTCLKANNPNDIVISKCGTLQENSITKCVKDYLGGKCSQEAVTFVKSPPASIRETKCLTDAHLNVDGDVEDEEIDEMIPAVELSGNENVDDENMKNTDNRDVTSIGAFVGLIIGCIICFIILVSVTLAICKSCTRSAGPHGRVVKPTGGVSIVQTGEQQAYPPTHPMNVNGSYQPQPMNVNGSYPPQPMNVNGSYPPQPMTRPPQPPAYVESRPEVNQPPPVSTSFGDYHFHI
ncbi:unnamed protein product [Mytilus coruscus]|uniref:Uncharacterized protein n=1 Tax=Mytilus coruscus TaxID=42192 RepID=A0A6J8C5D5_MYTCO|nr:unnamed protein product [Mytilus coruscus]